MRPKIICHMVSSIDGRLITDRWTPPAGQAKDELLAHYEKVAARLPADGWIVGRKTMERHYARERARYPTSPRSNLRETYKADRRGRNLAVAIDPLGKLHYGREEVDGYHLVAVLGEQVSNAYLAELREDGVSYLFAGSDGKDLHHAMDTLGKDFGVGTILLEGGGIINGAFLKAGLIDEISLLVYPGIDGLAGMPSIFETLGGADEHPAAGRVLRHVATETLEGGMVWLRYTVENTRFRG